VCGDQMLVSDDLAVRLWPRGGPSSERRYRTLLERPRRVLEPGNVQGMSRECPESVL
jgi:hypothetical protein